MGFEIIYLLPNKERNRYGQTQIESERKLLKFGNIVKVPLRRKYKYILQDAFSLKKILDQKTDNYILISYTSYAGKISRILYLLGLVRNVYHSHNCIQNKRFIGLEKIIEWFFEKFLANQVKYYLSAGPSETQILVNNLGVNPEKLLLFSNFRSLEKTEKGKIEYEYIYVGRMVKDKGVETLLKAFLSLNMLNKIIFIGDGRELGSLMEKYPGANFTGKIPADQVLNYLNKSKYYISASHMEGMSFSVIEALSVGTVPLLTDVEGHRDIIIEGHNRFLFKNNYELFSLIFKHN